MGLWHAVLAEEGAVRPQGRAPDDAGERGERPFLEHLGDLFGDFLGWINPEKLPVFVEFLPICRLSQRPPQNR